MCFIYILIRFVVVVVVVVVSRVSINVDWVARSGRVEGMNGVRTVVRVTEIALLVDTSQQYGWTAEDEK